MALNATEVETARLQLAETTQFYVFPLLLETVLWGRFSTFTSALRVIFISLYFSHLYHSSVHFNLCSSVNVSDPAKPIETDDMSVLRSRGLNSRSKRVMVTFTLIMYVLSTICWAIDVRRVWSDLNITIPGELSIPPKDLTHQNTMNTLLRIIQSITNNICVRSDCD